MLFLRNSLLIVIFSISTLVAFNTASEYYDAASQTYILENNIKGAKKYINDGLTVFPNDTQLNKLGKVIKEEEDQQNKNKNKDNKDQQNKDQKNQDQNKDQNQQDKKDQEKKDDNNKDNKDKQNNDQDQQKEQQQKEQQQQAQQDESKQDMKKEEAKRLIELYADDADSLNKPQKKSNASKAKFQKDW